MAASKNDDLVELKPISPFCGTYRCSLADADFVDDSIDENELGQIVRTKVPKKRFLGLISVHRLATIYEIEAAQRGELPSNIEILNPDDLKRIKPGMHSVPNLAVVEHPATGRTVKVPASIAEGLIARGLAEAVGSKL